MHFKNKKTEIFFTFLLCLFILSVSIVPVSATTYDESLIETSIGRTVFSWAQFIYGTGMTDKISGLLEIDVTSAEYSTLWATVSNIYTNIIRPVGVYLTMIYVLLSIVDKLQMEQINGEILLKLLIKMFLSIIVMNNGMTILLSLLQLGNDLLNSYGVTGSLTAGDTITLTNYYNACCSLESGVANAFTTFTSGLQMMFELMLPYIGMYLCFLIIYAIALSRLIEIFVRAAFAPIGMANIFTSGTNSSGFRYIKKFAAVCLQGFVILVIIIAYGQINTVIVAAQGFSQGISQLVLCFTIVAVMFKSQTLASEIVGAQ